MRRVTSRGWFVSLAFLLLSGAAAADIEVRQPPRMDLGESWARGYVRATCEADDQGRALMFRLHSFREVATDLPDHFFFLSPNPAAPGYSVLTAQDVTLRRGYVVDPGAIHDFAYGSYATATDDPYGTMFGVDSWYGQFDPWWCGEERQYTRIGTIFYFGGETANDPLAEIVEGTDPLLDTWFGFSTTLRQARIWDHLRNEPTVMVGKGPLWSLLPPGEPASIPVQLTVTNVGYAPATGTRIEDTVPAGWSYAGDGAPPPDSVTVNPDRTTTLLWTVSLDAAQVPASGLDPTIYDADFLRYTLLAPPLPPQARVLLPGARADGDAVPGAEGHSAPPLAEVAPEAREGERVLFDWRGTDPSVAFYEWDWNGDGIADATGPEPQVVWGDNWRAPVSVKGTYRADTTISVTDPKPVYVRNVPPTAAILRITMPFSITIRVAGEKWNEVCLDLLEDGGTIGHVCIERQPGSPDRQSATIQGELDLLKSHALRVSYDAADEPVNGRVKGGNPVWLETPDGRKRLHHTFVVSQGGPEQTWEPDPFSLLVVAGTELTFEGRSTDPGSDDLTLSWDFDGDGTLDSSQLSTADPGGAPDPFPSPEMNPRDVTGRSVHAYDRPGTYRVVFRSEDDDGGRASDERLLVIP